MLESWKAHILVAEKRESDDTLRPNVLLSMDNSGGSRILNRGFRERPRACAWHKSLTPPILSTTPTGAKKGRSRLWNQRNFWSQETIFFLFYSVRHGFYINYHYKY